MKPTAYHLEFIPLAGANQMTEHLNALQHRLNEDEPSPNEAGVNWEMERAILVGDRIMFIFARWERGGY